MQIKTLIQLVVLILIGAGIVFYFLFTEKKDLPVTGEKIQEIDEPEPKPEPESVGLTDAEELQYLKKSLKILQKGRARKMLSEMDRAQLKAMLSELSLDGEVVQCAENSVDFLYLKWCAHHNEKAIPEVVKQKCFNCAGNGLIKCPSCSATGKCLGCDGSGFRRNSRFTLCPEPLCNNGRCKECRGKGKFICKECNGTGANIMLLQREFDRKQIQVAIDGIKKQISENKVMKAKEAEGKKTEGKVEEK